MKFFNKVFSQTGSAIILALVAVGIISSLVVYLMNFSVDTNKKIVDDARVISYKNLVEIVRSRIYSGTTCTQLLGGVSLPNAAFTVRGISVPLNLQLDMNKRTLRAPLSSDPNSIWRLKGGTSIKDVRLVINERLRSPVFSPGPPNPGIFPNLRKVAAKGFILIIPDHLGVGVYLNQNRHYRIPIFLYYEGTAANRKLHSCFDPVGEAFICTMTAFGAYDISQPNPLLRCQPQRYCKPDGQGVLTSGSCSPPYVKKIIGFASPNTSRFICEWCSAFPITAPCYDNQYAAYYDEPVTKPYNALSTPFKTFNGLTNVAPDYSPFNPCKASSTTGGTTGGGGGVTGGGGGGVTGGGGGCFVAGTEITLLDGSKKNIEDIGLGESLIDLRGSKVKVQKLISYDYDGPIYSINGGPYFFTPNHPFLSTSGWKSLDPKKSMEEAPGIKVSYLMLGDILLKKDGVEVVLSLDSMNIKDKVYNFTLDGTHEYIANDYAVHNKMPQMVPYL